MTTQGDTSPEGNTEHWLERHRGLILLVVVAVVVAAIVLINVLRPQPPPIILNTATPLPSPEATLTPQPVRVYVSGAVRNPDVYILAPDSIVKDALLAAGGAADDADLDRINLALSLADGQQIHVPRLGEENPPVQPPSRHVEIGGRVNINTADLATLQSLPGIGPVIAQRILDHRQTYGPFQTLEDLLDVSGIGPATLEAIQGQITTE